MKSIRTDDSACRLRAATRVAVLPVGLAVLTLLAACGGGKKAGPPPAAPVTTAKAVQKDVPIVVSAIGTVEPYNSVSIKSLVGGEITRVAFKEGQDVHKGDLLFVIDPRPYQAALQQAQSILARDRAQMASAEAQAARYAELVKKDYVTKQEYDDAVAAAGAVRSSVQADEAGVEAARVNLGYCTIRAPIEGRTGNVLVQLGNVVKANDVPLLVLNQIAPIYVTFSVPESYLPQIRRESAQSPLKVTASSSDGSAHDGELTLINNQVDSATGAILLKATFPNADKALWPGSFVNLSLTLSTRKGAVVVPDNAVQEGQKGTYVFVIKGDSTADMRPVTVGQRMGGEALIDKGLEAGEEVVTDGQLRLFPGAKVEIRSSLTQPGAGETPPSEGGPR
jgi:multidrug efflux system membrane fusion protein